MEELIQDYSVAGKKIELWKKTYDDGSYFYYLHSIPQSISVGYSGSHNLDQMMLKFNSICKYIDNRSNDGRV